LQLRRMTLGERFASGVSGPACRRAMGVEFLTQDILIEPRPHKAATYTWPSEAASRVVHYRLPNGADQDAVADLSPEKAVEALLARCVIDDGGVPLNDEERAGVIA